MTEFHNHWVKNEEFVIKAYVESLKWAAQVCIRWWGLLDTVPAITTSIYGPESIIEAGKIYVGNAPYECCKSCLSINILFNMVNTQKINNASHIFLSVVPLIF